MIDIKQLETLHDVYTKVNLEKGLLVLVRNFYASHPFQTWEDFNPQSIISLLNSKKTFSKTELVIISFSILQNNSILKAFLESLSADLMKIIEKLLFKEEMSDSEVSNFLGKEVVKIQAGYLPQLQRELYFFTVKETYEYTSREREYVYQLSLHPIIKNLLLPFFPKPRYYDIIGLDEIPETDFRFSAEALIQQELPRLLSYSMQQNIKYNTSGRPADATIAKMQRTCAITEYYISENAEINKIRSILMAGLLYEYSLKSLTENNINLLKDLFTSHYLKLHSPVFILQQLKGWQYLSGLDFYKDIEKKLQSVFQLLPKGKWVSVENLQEYLIIRAIDIKPVSIAGARNYLHYQTLYEHGSIKIPEKKEVEYSTYAVMVKNSFVTGTIFLYAAFGLIEIAYNNINTEVLGKTFYSAYDGLQYLKLTSLGAYVLGRTNTYEASEIAKTNKLVFDEDSLTILAEGDLDVINVSLSNYAERLAANRYRVTTAYFLKDCKNQKDIQNKITLFKNTINNKLPANWDNFFSQLVNNAKAVKEVRGIATYQLPPDAKELQKIVAQDSVLKQLILKAENFYILVLNSNDTKFKTRMKELGYIVE